MLRDIGGWIKKLAGSSEQPPSGTGAQFDEYVNSAPSNQNAIDCVPGWNHALPPQAGVTAGKAFLYNDPRIIWAIEQFGSIENCNILEFGPLEASHTYLIDKHNPKNIDAVEANRLAYLRCLIAKEILELKHAKFYLGNFVPWLENSDRRYDFIFMSGVPKMVRFWLVIVIAAGILFIGGRFLAAPAGGAEGFGVPLPRMPMLISLPRGSGMSYPGCF